MKVDNVNSNRITQKQAENAAGVEKNQKSERENLESLAGKDKASLSEDARILAKSRTALEETPDMRTELVEQLRQEIASGKYQIPVQDLADRLLGG
ncbi:MAG: flagellar biosynthesis anti-sigma factor FlgM [Anaerolineales bacterium]|nr:flagellar biosynthesis anti-sigma factor FlgM [Anaerolineales bacterium]